MDKVSSLFWLTLSLFVLYETKSLPFGSISQPKAGFFPFVLGVSLGILSITLFMKSWLGEEGKRIELDCFPNRKGWKNIILVSGAIFVFYLVFESVGFLLSTFLFMLALIRFVVPHKWSHSAWVAAVITICSYVMFEKLLQSNLPKGLFEGLGF